MCLIIFAYRSRPRYRLIAAANRDEFFDRPTLPAQFWDDAPHVLAGRDLKEGGTWLGITRQGKFAAVTNFRDPASIKPDAPSRGQLVADFLTGRVSAATYMEKVSRIGHRYNGFNLICGDPSDLFYYSNRGDLRRLSPGVYGLSNALLDSPWPKVLKGKKAMEAALQHKGTALEEQLFHMLADRKTAPPHRLPQTGVTPEWEKVLSAVFIQSPNYGTRSSTVIRFAQNGWVTFVERSFNGSNHPWLESRFSFLLPSKAKKR
jgi:uncharacterized protein with NRDE domain